MNILKTKYGNLKSPIVVGKYATGEIEELKFEEENSLQINEKKFIPVYDLLSSRIKDLPSVKLFKNGNIKALSVQEATTASTEYGDFEVEKVTFYDGGRYNRLFFLNGKISGFWSEEDEYNLAKNGKIV